MTEPVMDKALPHRICHSDYIVYVGESGDHSLTSIDPIKKVAKELLGKLANQKYALERLRSMATVQAQMKAEIIKHLFRPFARRCLRSRRNQRQGGSGICSPVQCGPG